MAETALQLKGPQGPIGETGPFFLCHNSKDKGAVKLIADALSLEFGTRFFLDAYAIPVGEEFLRWIERTLVESSGCAIFLGAHGWGATHLWEAEKGLGRYKADPRYKLIPVALPGILPADMQRLGAGAVFQEINWADFTQGLDDRDSLEKLAAAIAGRELPQDRGPARLTPYQIRRDAQRWRAAKNDEESILYRGGQLLEAERLVKENPDFVVVDEVMPFLTASRVKQTNYWRTVAVGGIVATALFLGLTVATYVGYTLAEQRRATSLSRQLAIVSRNTASPDRGLLISVRALLVADTPEARGNILERLQTLRYLRRVIHVGSSIEAVTIGGSDNRLLLGTSQGDLQIASADLTQPLKDIPLDRSHGSISAIAFVGEAVWLGREDGSVEVQTTGSSKVVVPAPAHAGGKNLAILALARQKSTTLIAVGTGSGRLLVIDTANNSILCDFDEGEHLRITSVAFDPSGHWLAAGTGDRDVLFVDLTTKKIRQRYPGIDGGVVALGYSQPGTLSVLSAYGELTTLVQKNGDFQRERSESLSGVISAAAIDGSHGRLAVGDASGQIRLYDLSGKAILFGPLPGHGAPVSALAFDPKGDTLLSASRDGTAVVWDPAGTSGPSTRLPSFAPEPSVLRVAHNGDILAAASTSGAAGIWRLKSGAENWSRIIDLIAETRTVASSDALEPVAGNRSDSGFVPVGDSEISSLSMDADGATVVWTTRHGAVLFRPVDVSDARTVLLLPATPDGRGDAVISGDGRVVAVASDSGREIIVLNALANDPRSRTISVNDKVRSLALDSGGSTLAVGLDDGAIALYDAATGSAIGAPGSVHNAPVSGVVFAGNRRIFSYGAGGGGSDRTVASVPVPALAPIARLQARQVSGSVASLSVGPQTNILAAADQNGQVLMWSYSDTRFIAQLEAGESSIAAIFVDDSRERLISASSDGTFLSFTLNRRDWIKLACFKANRSFREDEWTEIMPDDKYQPACDAPH